MIATMIIKHHEIGQEQVDDSDEAIFRTAYLLREEGEIAVLVSLRGVESLDPYMAHSLLWQVTFFRGGKHLIVEDASPEVMGALQKASLVSHLPFMYLNQDRELRTYWPQGTEMLREVYGYLLLGPKTIGELMEIIGPGRRAVDLWVQRLYRAGLISKAGVARHQFGPGRPRVVYETLRSVVEKVGI